MTVDEDGPEAMSEAIYAGADPDFMVAIVPGGTLGAVTLGPDGNSFLYDPAGAFEALGAGETATDTVTVRVTADGVTESRSFTVEVAGANDAPVAAGAIGEQVVRAGEPLGLVLPPELFADIDGDALVWTVRQANGSALPGWLVFDATTGALTGIAPDTLGTLALVAEASDGTATAQAPFALEVLAATAQAVAVGEDNGAALIPPLYRDGDPDAVVTIDAAGTLGAVALDADGALTYTPAGAFEALAAGEAGTDTFALDVTANGVTTRWTYTVAVAGANDAPVVAGAVAEPRVNEGDALSFTLPADLFADVDGDALTLTATLAGGGALPGWLTFDAATGTFSGTAPVGLTGEIALSVGASDGALAASAPLTITVLPQTQREIAVGEDDFGLLIDPVYLERDPDAVVTVDASGTAGAVTVDPEGNIRYAPDGAFEGLARGATGSDTFTVTVESGGLSKVWTYAVAVAGANDAPFATAEIGELYVKHGTFWSYTVPADLFADPDGDPLDYAAYANITEALPEWMGFDAATRTYSGFVPAEFTGEIDLKIQALDGLATGGTRFLLNVTSGPAVQTPIPAQSSPEDAFWSFTVPPGTFANLTGDPLTYSATMGNGLPLPDWISFDPATLTLSGQPPQDFTGAFNMRVAASDGSSVASAKFNLAITEVPETPTRLELTTPWITAFAEPGSAVGALSTADPDQIDNFTYTLLDDAGGLFRIVDDVLVVNGPLDAQVNGGRYDVTVRSTDASGFHIDAEFTVQAQAPGAGELFADATPIRYLWVATDGVDAAGGGAEDAPLASIQFAIGEATPGTAIMVRAGTYAESLFITKSGETDAPIWLRSADGIGAAEIKPPAGAEINAIDAMGVQNFVIEGFAITGTDTIGTYGLNMVSTNNGAKASYEDGWAGRLVANVVVKDNIITDWGIDGIHIAQSFNLQILNNSISGAHEQGIDFITGRRLVIAGNEIGNITAKPAWFGLDQREYVGDSAITVKGGSSEVLIVNNVIGTTNGYGIKVGAPSGLAHDPIEYGLDGDGGHYVSYEASDVLVRGNTVLNSSGGAIDIFAGHDVVIQENLLTHVRMIGFERAVAGLVYGNAEQFLPLGTDLQSDNIRFIDNVHMSANLHNVAEGVHYSDSGNVRFDPAATYAAEDYAWVLGTSGPWDAVGATVNGNNLDNVLFGDAGGVARADYVQGRGGVDTMHGGFGDDTYMFDVNQDVAVEAAHAGTDTVVLTKNASRYIMPTAGEGGAIENVVVARNGATSVLGNALDNVISGGRGDDQLRGNFGDDTIYGLGGADGLSGGAGRDRLNGGDGDDSLYGGVDDDVLDGGAGRDRLDGGAGNDALYSFDADARLDGGIGIDLAYIDRSTATAAITLDISAFGNGTAGPTDTLQQLLPDGTRLQNIERIAISTGSGADRIVGGFFEDEISAGDGADHVDGNDGDDRLWGASGEDQLFGGAGADKIDGGTGADYLYGGADDDELSSQEADFVLDGGDGVDVLILNRSYAIDAFVVDIAASTFDPAEFQTLADGTSIRAFEAIEFVGGAGDDFVTGGSRNDAMSGGNGRDTFRGGEGSDRLSGNADVDTLIGGSGGDVLVGGGGGDHLWGGSGDDTFKFVGVQPSGDIIYDFEGAGKRKGDILSFTGYGPGATLTYDPEAMLWTVASADGRLASSFTIVGVTYLGQGDYILM